MFKNTQILILSTGKEDAAILYNPSTYKYSVRPNHDHWSTKECLAVGYSIFHLYFLSDEELKEGDLKYNPTLKHIVKHVVYSDGDKKIIASTDKSLGLPMPNNQFLQQYCELSRIDEVKVEYEFITTNEDWSKRPVLVDGYYKIKLAEDNTINIKLIKENYTQAEVETLLHQLTQELKSSVSPDQRLKLQTASYNWIQENII